MIAPLYVQYELRESGVGILTLDNPPLNLTTLTTLERLMTACRQIALC
jgi:enoyl-CoA hydratase/carnithine racemase